MSALTGEDSLFAGAEQTSKHYTTSSWLWLTSVITIFILVVFFVGTSGEFPVNDDRLYTSAVRDYVQTGKLRIEVTNAFDFLPIYFGAAFCKLFGFSYEHLRFTTIGFHLFGTAGLFLAVKELGGKDEDAALISGLYSLNPFMLNLSLSFMTDVPALAITNWSFLCLVAGIKRRSLTLASISVLFLVAAMSVRQTAIVFFPAIWLTMMFVFSRKKERLLLLPLLLVPLLAYKALHLWLMSVQDSSMCYQNYSNLLVKGLSTLVQPLELVEMMAKGSCYLGLFFLPLTLPLLIGAARLSKKASSISITLAFIVVVCPLVYIQMRGAFMPYSLNLFYPPILGTYCILGGVPLWSNEHMKEFTCFSDFAAFLFVFAVVLSVCKSAAGNLDRINTWETLLAASVSVFLVTGLAVQLAVSNFDRYYLLGLGPLLICLVPVWREHADGRLRFLSLLLCLGTSTYGFLAASDQMNFLRAQKEGVLRLTRAGVEPSRIDGGPMHTLQLNVPAFLTDFKQGLGWSERLRGRKDLAKIRWWPVAGEDYILSTIPLPGYHIHGEIKYWSALAFKQRKIFILETDSLGL